MKKDITRRYLVLPLHKQQHPSCPAVCWEFLPPPSLRRSLLSSGKCLLFGPWSTCARIYPWSAHLLQREFQLWFHRENPKNLLLHEDSDLTDRHCLPSWTHYERSSCWSLIRWRIRQTCEGGRSEWFCPQADQAHLEQGGGHVSSCVIFACLATIYHLIWGLQT